MMRFTIIFTLAMVAACDPPPLSLRFRLTDSGSQRCISDHGTETTNCDDITMGCDAVLSVRIVPPEAPEFPYLSVCKPLLGGQRKLCSIAGVDLQQPTVPIPERVLEVQMAVFPRSEVGVDSDGDLLCPRVDFAANGLPLTGNCFVTGDVQCVRPAVGGRAYYYPGDAETVVELGCTEQGLLNAPECIGSAGFDVAASINDFTTNAAVGNTVADRLRVSFGEPRVGSLGTFEMIDAYTRQLSRPGNAGATWVGESIDLDLMDTYCVEVFEDVAQATATLTCEQVTTKPVTHLDVTGFVLDKAKLAEILAAIGSPIFPDNGLVIGVVLNRFGVPVAGAQVEPSCAPACTIKYLAEDGQSVTTNGTSTNGIWISTDSTYPARFSWSGRASLGGLIRGKTTIVVLQESTSVGM